VIVNNDEKESKNGLSDYQKVDFRRIEKKEETIYTQNSEL
jgi:hypothetical protein